MGTNDTNQYIKSGIWYTVGNILIKGISFLALPIFTRLLSPDDFGKYNVFLSYENIFNVVIGLGLSGTIKVAFFDFNEHFNKYFSSVVSLTVFAAVVFDVFANVLILSFNWFDNSMWNVELVNLLIFSSLATALYNLLSTKYVIEVKYKENLGISLVYTVSNLLLSIFFCLTIYSAQRYLGRILGQTLPLILLAGLLCGYYILKYKAIVVVEYWKYALKLGLPLILHMLSMVVLLQIGKLMIDYFCGSTYTGIYSVAATLASTLSLLMGSFDNAWAPWFYRGLSGEKGINLVSGDNKVSVFFAFLMVEFMLISPEVLMIMTTSDYYDAIYSIVPLTLAVYANFMYLFAVNQEYYYKKTSIIAIGTIIATISGIILNYVLIPQFGYITAAYVDLVCKLILYIIHTIVVKRMKKQPVVSNRLLWILFMGTSVIGIVTLLLKDYVYVRAFIALLLCVTIYRPLMEFIKSHRMSVSKQ